LTARPALSVAAGLTVAALVAWGALGARSHAAAAAAAPNQALFTAARADVPRSDHLGCTKDYFITAIEPVCFFGPADATVTVGLFGDSHAVEFFPTFERLAIAHHWRLVMLTKSECPAVDVEPFIDKLGR